MMTGAAALAMFCWTSCFPDDYLDETKKEPPQTEKPDPKPETGGNEGTEQEKPGTDNKLTYDDLAQYD